MEITNMKGIRVLAVLAGFLLLPGVGNVQGASAPLPGNNSASGEAPNITRAVNCNAGDTIQEAVDNSNGGDTVLVSGTCNENVNISTGKTNITIDGQGTATINGTDTTQATVRITGRNITIKGFNILGGRDGISVFRGGTATIAGNTVTGAAGTRDGIIVSRGAEATIDGNTVQSWGRLGINLDQNGTARIINNTIQNNSSHGVSVSASSSGRIGFLTFGDTSAGPNTIQNNGRDGVNVNRSSSAIILSNTISGNHRHGVGIFRASHADVGGNTIESNGFPPPSLPATNDGIRVEENSGVNLGQPGGLAFTVGENTTATNNTGFGLKCRIGGYVRGNLGSLNGNSGLTSIATSEGCINVLNP